MSDPTQHDLAVQIIRELEEQIEALEAENQRLRDDRHELTTFAIAESTRIGRIVELCKNARLHSGGSFTAHVDVLSIERAINDRALADEGAA